MDIEEVAGFGIYDTLALKWLKVIATYIHFIGYNFSQSLLICYLQSLTTPIYHLIARRRVPPTLPMGVNEGTEILFYDKHLLAYICGSDKAVAGDVNRFATFPAVS